MTPGEFMAYFDTTGPSMMVSGADVEGDNRTLLYGYNLDRQTVHVYLDGEIIHRHVYGYAQQTISHQAERNWNIEWLLRGQKRFYPERCDLGFSKLLREKGVEPCFTTYDEKAWAATRAHDYHGLTCGCAMRYGVHYDNE